MQSPEDGEVHGKPPELCPSLTSEAGDEASPEPCPPLTSGDNNEPPEAPVSVVSGASGDPLNLHLPSTPVLSSATEANDSTTTIPQFFGPSNKSEAVNTGELHPPKPCPTSTGASGLPPEICLPSTSGTSNSYPESGPPSTSGACGDVLESQPCVVPVPTGAAESNDNPNNSTSTILPVLESSSCKASNKSKAVSTGLVLLPEPQPSTSEASNSPRESRPSTSGASGDPHDSCPPSALIPCPVREAADQATSSQPVVDPTATDESKKKEIGPYATAVGLFKTDFDVPIRDAVFPHVKSLKNGLVLELHQYLTETLQYNQNSCLYVLCKLTRQENVNEKSISSAISRLVQSKKKKVRGLKGDKRESEIKKLQETEFKLVRKRIVSSPETQKEKRLRLQVQMKNEETVKLKRKLCATEDEREALRHRVDENEGLMEELEKERSVRKKATEEVLVLKEEREKLMENVKVLTAQYSDAMTRLNDINLEFNPMKDDLAKYKSKYEQQSALLEDVRGKYMKAQAKLGTYNTRNVNKRIKTRDAKIKKLEEEKRKKTEEDGSMQEAMNNLKEELKDSEAKLNECIKERDRLLEKAKQATEVKKNAQKAKWKINEQRKRAMQGVYTEEDVDCIVKQMEDRIDMLKERNNELNCVIAMMNDEQVTTFKDGQYTDEVRETIMALLSMNVAVSKVGEVIKVVLEKLAHKSVTRLPSAGTITEIRLEARHLADLEIGLAMMENRPEDAIGNVIHGDGTTKYHKKYENLQVTLPDGSSRSVGLTQMAASDTEAVVRAYKARMKELADAIASCKMRDEEEVFNELLATVKSSMTDQGPTMPQFAEQLKAIREDLLPQVVSNWQEMPTEVQQTMSEFGAFFCKMHPIINFAEECNKVLKAFEDISTQGKNVHTLLTSESGVTRLIRTSSKAFHHRGSDQSGMEDAFTSYLENQFSTKNYLVNYIGNRANILFEGAVAVHYHLEHLTGFVNSIPHPNNLLLAVAEDAQEKIHKAELRALGIVHKCVTEPLWNTTKSAPNILFLNQHLHHLQLKLANWKEDASTLMEGEMGLEVPMVEDDISSVLFEDTGDAELHGMTQQALELICCALLIILERQCKDQLPGGKYWDMNPDSVTKYSNVPATNVVGERDFAWLDFLVRQKPSARTITLETIIMWSNNGTRLWLDSLDEETKATYMAEARAHAPKILKRYQEKMVTIKNQRWEQLQKKQEEKDKKEAKQVAARAKLTNDVAAQGGVWCTEAGVESKFKELNRVNRSDEVVRRALHTQLQFHQKILKSKTPQKEFFQLSTTVGGEQKKFSKHDMKKHLIEIIKANNLPSDPDEVEIPEVQPPRPVTYTDAEKQQEEYAKVKEKMVQKITTERQRRAIEHSKNFMDRLAQQPQLLVNKRVKHQCFDPQGVARWFDGQILHVQPFDGEDVNKIISQTMFTIKYDESQLGEGEPLMETFPLLMDLKGSDLIIVDNI